MSHCKYIDLVIPEFSVRLCEAMQKAGMSQAELGRRIGRDRRIVGSYCRGERYPSFECLVLICRTLHVSADYLLELED